MKILLLEDDLPLGTALHRALTADGHAVMWLRTASDAEAFLMAERFDLALLDIVLPDGSGLDVLARLRARGDATPVMMLTARDTVSDRVNGLDAGADDYLPKPFAIEELLSRMRALLRRRGTHLSAVWHAGRIAIDTSRRRVTVDGAEIALSVREYDILVALATDPGTVLTRTQIEHRVSFAEGTESNRIDVHIHNLRRKIGAHLVTTVRGIGYVLEKT